MKFTTICALAGMVNAAAKTEGYECVKGTDTCTADTASNPSKCCNIQSNLLTTLETTLCVDTTKTKVTDKTSSTEYTFDCNAGYAAHLATSMMAAASAIYMMQ